MTLDVSPQLAVSPAAITILLSIEPSNDNRKVVITTESADFARRSEIALDGSSARTTTLRYANLPAGGYAVRGELIGRDGRSRGLVERSVMVIQ